jgi:hypothetical protein
MYQVIVPQKFDVQFVRAVASNHGLVEIIHSWPNTLYVFSNEDDQETFEAWFNQVREAEEG